MTSSDTAYCSPQAVIHEEVKGEVVILHTQTYNSYLLNNTGAIIWTLLQSGCCAKDIVTTMGNWLHVSLARLHGEVGSFITLLLEENLIVSSSASPAAPPGVLAMEIHPFSTPAMSTFADAWATLNHQAN
jgi:hypothetical protein